MNVGDPTAADEINSRLAHTNESHLDKVDKVLEGGVEVRLFS